MDKWIVISAVLRILIIYVPHIAKDIEHINQTDGQKIIEIKHYAYAQACRGMMISLPTLQLLQIFEDAQTLISFNSLIIFFCASIMVVASIKVSFSFITKYNAFLWFAAITVVDVVLTVFLKEHIIAWLQPNILIT